MNWEWKEGKKNFAAKHKNGEVIIEISIFSRFEWDIFCSRKSRNLTKLGQLKKIISIVL